MVKPIWLTKLRSLMPEGIVRESVRPAVAWRGDLAAAEWDSRLVHFGGHPRQSALWESIRTEIDGAISARLSATMAGETICMVRYEIHDVPGLGTVAWIPRGPVSSVPAETWLPSLEARLADAKLDCVVMDPWSDAEDSRPLPRSRIADRTIWLDLRRGTKMLWQELDKQWRYGVSRAARQGVAVERTSAPADIVAFVALCQEIGAAKNFRFSASPEKITRLLQGGAGRTDLETALFVARVDGQVAAGAFIIRFGKSAHYFWGGTRRDFSRQRPGEAVQWASIEWAVAQGAELYDLEGVDPEGNPGVHNFKKKMGGRQVELVGKTFRPISAAGRQRLDSYLKSVSSKQ